MHKSEENLSKQKKITEVDLQRELDRRTPTELTFVALLVGRKDYGNNVKLNVILER